MTVNHIFYIPLILAIGVMVGYLIAKRQLRLQQAREERERRLLETKRKERQQKRESSQ